MTKWAKGLNVQRQHTQYRVIMVQILLCMQTKCLSTFYVMCRLCNRHTMHMRQTHKSANLDECDVEEH